MLAKIYLRKNLLIKSLNVSTNKIMAIHLKAREFRMIKYIKIKNMTIKNDI